MIYDDDERELTIEESTAALQHFVVRGVDLATAPSYSVFRCTCGYTSNRARDMLIHQRAQHGARE